MATVTGSPASSQVVGGPTPASLGVVPGARVRVLTADSGAAPQIGALAAVRDDGVVFRREGQGDSLTIPFVHMGRLDVSHGRHAHPIAGMAIGLGGGALVGALVGVASYKKSSFLDFGRGFDAGVGAFVGGVSGTVIGLIAGALIRTERWQTLPLNSLIDHAQTGVSLVPAPTGPRLAVRVALCF